MSYWSIWYIFITWNVLFPMAQVAGNKNVHKIPHYFLAAFHVFSHVVIHFVRSFSSRNLEMENAD